LNDLTNHSDLILEFISFDSVVIAYLRKIVNNGFFCSQKLVG